MVLLDRLFGTAGALLQRWWNGGSREGHCACCGAGVEAPLTECLDCLGERHW